MAGQFNELMHGEAATAASLCADRELDNGELRAALYNALMRIDRLEQDVMVLRNAARTHEQRRGK